LGNLQTPISVQKLQMALHAKAKEEPRYRFYLLYDKVYRPDVLDYAYRSCKANKGAAGVDGVRFEDIEAYGAERWLGELAERLKKKDYRPEAVKRVWIPKPNGKLRPLGIPTITDRVVQTAAMLVLEPIFEADLQPEQYAYRAERGAQDAVQAVHRLLNTGHRQVIDADLSGYFDSIPHLELMKSVARRIVDRHVLHLIKQWLEAPVEEDDGHGHRQRTTSNRDTGRGTPQGAPISPLLSNLYMRRFILGWKTLGYAPRWSAQIVNYADDFVICCKGRAEDAMDAMRGMMETLKLTVNDDKTHLCQIPQERFDFLGYTFGRCYSQQDRARLLGHPAFAEEHQTHGGKHHSGNRSSPNPRGCRACRGTTEPETERLGELLLPRPCQPGLSGDQHPRHTTASPVVVQETQGSWQGEKALPRSVSPRAVGAGQPAGKNP
jgi:RNA-directed DNA polymerase